MERNEDYVHVLDFLPEGRPGAPAYEREPMILGVGESFFTLFELVPKKGSSFTVGERTYIGRDSEQRTIVDRIRQRVTYDRMTPAAHGELPFVVEDIIDANPGKFLAFFNLAEPLSLRMHALELLPNVGKKTAETIVAARREGRFDSFEDVHTRGKLADPKRAIVDRIMLELENPTEKYHVFTRPMAKDDGRGRRGGQQQNRRF